MSFRILMMFSVAALSAAAQSLGNAGTIQGTVVDPTGAIIPGAMVSAKNAVTGYHQEVTTGSDGAFRLLNLPPNRYHLDVTATGFAATTQDAEVRNAIPIMITVTLQIAGNKTTVEVEAAGADLLETTPSAHVDIDRNLIAKLPIVDPAGGLSQAITYATGGVAADANGFFHPLGDHSQVSFVVDGQPISDQQSKVFSTQLPVSAVQGMELITGTPGAEFGDKTSLVAQVTTRSGLGMNRVFGDVGTSYGSFGTTANNFGLGYGNAKFGNFLAVDGTRSGRFLDTPEFRPNHDVGNNKSLFDRIDYQPDEKNVYHLNLFAARNWIQIPNSNDQLTQDQRQRVMTWNFAPGYQHIFGSTALLSINPYIRKDQFNYYGSSDPLADTPTTQNQNRQLLNWGVKADYAVIHGRHNVKVGLDLKQTRLLENFGFGITNSALSTPELAPFDLTQGGSMFAFHATGNILQYGFYAQDSITLGNFLINAGFRLDRYDGLVTKTGPQPRLAVSYKIAKTGTVLRAAYARTFETPFNENLLLASAAGSTGLAQNLFNSTPVPVAPGNRNQFNVGFQQAIGKVLLIDADYFWKYTHNAYDFFALFNSTITFPVAWHNSKLDGFTGRISTTNLKGFQAYWTFGHTRARYFPPETGGLIPQIQPSGGVFRIDHDQMFQSTLNLRYQPKANREWISFSYRYDSGMVVSGVPDTAAALLLSPNQQATIGLMCAGVLATAAAPIQSCSGAVTSKLIHFPTPDTADPDHNPARVKARNVLNLGVGTDNLLHKDGNRRITASFEIANLTGLVGVYNFLSTFSGTHFLQPRSLMGRVGYTF